MPSHRPYQFVPVDVPISWRRRLLGGRPLYWLVLTLLWVGVIALLVSPYFWVVVVFAVLCWVVQRSRN